MAKRDIYLSDDLDQRARDAKISVSPLCQPVIGFAVLHGQGAAAEAVAKLGHDAGQAGQLEQLLAEQQDRAGQAAGHPDGTGPGPRGGQLARALAVFATVGLCLSALTIYLMIRTATLA